MIMPETIWAYHHQDIGFGEKREWKPTEQGEAYTSYIRADIAARNARIAEMAVGSWNADPRAPDPRLEKAPWLTCECGDTFTEDALCADCARTEREGLRYNLAKMAEALRGIVRIVNESSGAACYYDHGETADWSEFKDDIDKCRAALAEYDAQKGGGE